MSAATAAGWSVRQRQLLAAMGYRLYRQRPTGVEATGPTAVGATAGEAPAWPAAILPLTRSVLAAAAQDADAQVERLWENWTGLNLPSPVSLRDPAAKRALWPRLRALRRSCSKS